MWQGAEEECWACEVSGGGSSPGNTISPACCETSQDKTRTEVFEGREGIWLQRNKGVVAVSLRWHSFNHGTTQHNTTVSSPPSQWDQTRLCPDYTRFSLILSHDPRPRREETSRQVTGSNLSWESRSRFDRHQATVCAEKKKKMYIWKILSVHTYIYIKTIADCRGLPRTAVCL